MTIAPDLMEPLSVQIAKAVPIADLERVMLKTTGEGLYETWVGTGKPYRETAFDLIQRLSQRGVERIVLAELLCRYPSEAGLSAAIDKASPDARLAIPSAGQQVADVVSGLAAIKARLQNPAVREDLIQSGSQLRLIVETINSLDAYKSLHECLHQLQAKQYWVLKDAAKQLPTSREQASELRVYRNQLRSACLFARGAVLKLPEQPVVRTTETEWIDDLDAAGAQFHEAIDQRNPDRARSALKKIRRIMVSAPPRLNSMIVTNAKALPLSDLARTLSELAEATGAAEIKAALHALELIIPTIRAGVVEHREWQDADVRIGELDQLFEHGGTDLIEDFTSDWIELKAMVQDQIARDPGADWTKDMQGYIDKVDDDLASESVLGKTDADFQDAFAAFRGEAQYRFLTVDSRLKANCSALAQVSAPLNAILVELGL